MVDSGTPYTYADLIDFITDMDSRADGDPNPQTYAMLLNEGLGELSSGAGIRFVDFTNTVAGGLTLTSGKVRIPISTEHIRSVTYSGIPLRRTTREGLDTSHPGWSSVKNAAPTHYFQSGMEIELFPKPVDGADGKLVINAQAGLPRFVYGTDALPANDPMTYIPLKFQLVPAYYVLMMLPASSDAQIARVNKFTALWQAKSAEAKAAIGKLTSSHITGLF